MVVPLASAEFTSVSNRTEATLITTPANARGHTVGLGGRVGDDVDDAVDGISTPYGGAGTPNDLNRSMSARSVSSVSQNTPEDSRVYMLRPSRSTSSLFAKRP